MFRRRRSQAICTETPGRQAPDAQAAGTQPWTGRLTCEILTPSGALMGVMKFDFDETELVITFFERQLAVISRAHLAHWLRSPASGYQAGELTFHMRRKKLGLAIGTTSPIGLPPEIAVQLRAG